MKLKLSIKNSFYYKTNAFVSVLDKSGFIWELILGFVTYSENN